MINRGCKRFFCTPKSVPALLLTLNREITSNPSIQMATSKYAQIVKKILFSTSKLMKLEHEENIEGDIYHKKALYKLRELGYSPDINQDSLFVKFIKDVADYNIEILMDVKQEQFDDFLRKKEIKDKLTMINYYLDSNSSVDMIEGTKQSKDGSQTPNAKMKDFSSSRN